MYLSIYINTWPDARLSSLVHYLRNTEIKIKSNIKQTWGLTEIATLKIRKKKMEKETH